MSAFYNTVQYMHLSIVLKLCLTELRNVVNVLCVSQGMCMRFHEKTCHFQGYSVPKVYDRNECCVMCLTVFKEKFDIMTIWFYDG